MADFDATLNDYIKQVENALPDYLPDARCPQARVMEAMEYSLLSGGKRIRAALVMAFYKLFSGNADVSGVLPFACAIEMIHAYSLIHDDLPCMDDDDMRRGKPSCHIAYGEAVAMLAGDGLLTLAFETAACEAAERRFGSGKVLSAIRLLSYAAGTMGMIGGQVMDMENESGPVSLGVLQETDEKKTGALICVSSQIGAMLGGADETDMKAAADYAGRLGLAFQMVDDILDCTGDPEKLGKPVNSDAESHKSTYTSICGIERTREMALLLSGQAKEALAAYRESGFLCELADRLSRRDS